MGLIDLFRPRPQVTTKVPMPEPSQPDYEDYTSATVRQVEGLVAKYRNWNESQRLAEYARCLALDAALFNAKNLASCPLRLYRRAAGSGVLNVRRVTKANMRRLTDPRRVGAKAAMMADVAGDVVEVTDAEALSVLRRPDPASTGMAWDVSRWIAKQTYGEALLLHTGAGNLVRLMNQFARTQPDEDGLIAGWYYGRDTHRLAQYKVDSVLQMKWCEHPDNPYTGLGWLELAIREIEIDDYALAAELRRWQQGGYPDAVLSFDGVRTGKQLSDALKELAAQLKKRLGFLVMGEGKVSTLGLPKDMQYREGVEMAERRILNRAGIPESLYKLNDANLASSLTGHHGYAVNTLRPALCVDAEQWTELWLPRFEIDPDVYFFAYDEVSERDTQQDVTTAVSLVGAGIWSINRALSELGDDPVGEKGDELRVNGLPLDSMQPSPAFFGGGGGLLLGGNDNEETPVTPAAPKVEEQALNGAQIQQLVNIAQQVAQGVMPKETGIATALAAFPGVPHEKIIAIFDPIISGVAPTGGGGEGEPEPEGEKPESLIKSWGDADPYACCGHDHVTKDDDRLPNEAVRNFEKLLMQYFGVVGGRITAEAIASGQVDLTALNGELAEAIEPLISESVRVGGVAGYDQLGMDADFFDVAPDEAVRMVRERGNLVAELVGGTTEDAVREAIARGVEQQLTEREIRGMVQEALEDAAPGRAEAIARTEVANAQEAGSTAAWIEAGIEQNRWILAPNACSICVALVEKLGREGRESKAVPINEPFIKAGETLLGADGRKFTAAYDVYHAPLHPNDRCATIPVVPESEG